MMNNSSVQQAINQRYSGLAESSCCLSCGGAIHHAKPQTGETCVDLGSGRGTDVLKMAEAVGRDGVCYGIDISQGMLDKAKRNAEKLGIDNVRFIQSEFESLPLEDGTADLVISNCSINHAKDKPRVWREIARILKVGGRIAISDIYAIEQVPEEFRNDPAAVSECWAGAILKAEYLEMLEAAGLGQVQILEESKPYAKGKIQVASFTISAMKTTNLKGKP